MKKLFIFLLLASSLAFSQNEEIDDYLILKDIIKSFTKTANKHHAYLLPDSRNEYVITIINGQQKKFLGTLTEEDIYHDLGKDSILDKIFNEKEFDYLLSQKSEAKWDIGKLKIDNLLPYDKNAKTRDISSVITISKPIYTRDKNYALVQIETKTWKYISIYRKEKDKWFAYKGIEHISMQAKAEVWKE